MITEESMLELRSLGMRHQFDFFFYSWQTNNPHSLYTEQPATDEDSSQVKHLAEEESAVFGKVPLK